MTSRDEKGGELSEERIRELRDSISTSIELSRPSAWRTEAESIVSALNELLRRRTESRASARAEEGWRPLPRIDFTQGHLNGYRPGEPNECYCFNIENGRYCGRAKRWAGHGVLHEFVAEQLSPPSPPLRRESEQ